MASLLPITYLMLDDLSMPYDISGVYYALSSTYWPKIKDAGRTVGQGGQHEQRGTD